MARRLFVRTGNNGANAAWLIPDLGITVPTGAGWTLLSASSPSSPDGESGMFTAREIRDSVDLFDAIRNSDLEWSKDGSVEELAADYVADYSLTQDFSDDTLEVASLTMTSGQITLPQAANVAASFPSANEGDIAWDTDNNMPYFYDGSSWQPMYSLLAGTLDHGTLSGLMDDDHTQYALLAGDLGRNTFTGGADFSSASGLIVPQGTSTAGQTEQEGNLFWDTDDDALYMYNGTMWVTIATASGNNNDHGGLTGLLDDDHTQYLLLNGNGVRNGVTGVVNVSSGRFVMPQVADVPSTLTSAVEGELAWDSDDDTLWAYDGTQWFAIAPASGIIDDHGYLQGLLDDDHPQYGLLAGSLTRNDFTGGVDFSSTSGMILPNTTTTSGMATQEGNLIWDTDDNMLWVYDGTQWVSIPSLINGALDHGTLAGLGDDDHPQYTAWAQTETVTGLWTFNTDDSNPNFVLDPRASAPTTGNADGAVAYSGGVLYVYDGTRAKWLSVDRKEVVFGRKGNSKDIYLRTLDGIATSETGVRISRNATVTALTAQADSAGTWTLEVRRNDVVTTLTSLTVTAAQGNQDITINIDLNQGDELQVYMTSASGVVSPVGTVEIAYRL